jgi:class 3 adenylate cyclase
MADRAATAVTFVFTDIERSTHLLRELGDGYRDALMEHRRLITEAFEQSGGIVYSMLADEVSAVFEGAEHAVAGAIGAQRALASHSWPGDRPVSVRMGVHTGQALAGEGEYLGLDVHRTARICAAAHGGQVLLSRETAGSLGDRLPVGSALRALGDYPLRGLPRPEGLVQVAISGLRNEFPPPRASAGEPEPPDPETQERVGSALRRALSALRPSRDVDPASFERVEDVNELREWSRNPGLWHFEREDRRSIGRRKGRRGNQ